MERYLAEFIGTFCLIFFGCGSAIVSTEVADGIGIIGVALTFGLTLLTMIYMIGPISGCHLNPAVSFGVAISGRMDLMEAFKYTFVQVLGAIFGASILYLIQTGCPNCEIGAFASNGFGENSPMGYDVYSCFFTEFILTFFFVLVILKITIDKKYYKFSGIVIGLSLTLIHLISIPITNTSVNPARSTGQALFSYLVWPSEQLWFFWVAPISGGILAGFLFKSLENIKYEYFK